MRRQRHGGLGELPAARKACKAEAGGRYGKVGVEEEEMSLPGFFTRQIKCLSRHARHVCHAWQVMSQHVWAMQHGKQRSGQLLLLPASLHRSMQALNPKRTSVNLKPATLQAREVSPTQNKMFCKTPQRS